MGDGVIRPRVYPEAEPFWAALDTGLVLAARCGSCEHRWLPPTDCCPRCASPSVSLEPAATTGRLHTWTVVHLAADPVYASELPYVVGLAELDDGVRVYGRVVGVEREALRVGLPLSVEVHRVDGQALWQFVAAEEPVP